ncbi:efflux RND transporter periplasmic adaptor subunit [Limisphaera ngatamarikiensis]|uniref:Efflux RND transporter periplasmic adaptor subunit n=1 Tax=Limisphaera ngatamarikiensis TaxID=1324935 RepID=A0A6M1RZQ0_9BACT|nr:efflux RND transporter periplasmic adaptor subunit [Limisphaera ngatamarikiensis]NGO40232.1 efflux RND transporter periplasmic adaptor subunit [Limisphaera ngatamarikiensis]
MKKQIAWAVLIWFGVAAVLAGIKVLQIRTMIAQARNLPPPTEAVSVFEVREERWPRLWTAVGSVRAVRGVRVTSELPGVIREVAFEAGSEVAEGALLVRLDTSTEEAELRQAEAEAELARLELERVRALHAARTVSQAELDAAEAAWKGAAARVAAIRSTIDKKTVRAPFAGRLGVREVHVGQYLQAGAPIVSLQALDPVYVEFALPQQAVAQVRPGLAVEVTADAYPGRTFRGVVTATDPDVDPATRSLRVQATLPNPDGALRPGMYVEAAVVLPEADMVRVVPAPAVLHAPYGDSVFVVEAATNDASGVLVVRQQFVKLGRRRGDFISVTAGLEPGQRVVSAGVFRLRNGMRVTLTDVPTPEPSLQPQPAEG